MPKWNREQLNLIEDENNTARLHPSFPNLSVVTVGFFQGLRAKSAERFVSILGNNLHSALHTLAAGITDDNKAIRQLCVESIQLAGTAAVEVIPSLSRELYLAPHDEGLEIANALAELSSPGIEILNAVATCSVPSIRSSAKSALSKLKVRSGQPGVKREPPPPLTSAESEKRDRKQRHERQRLIAFVRLFLVAVSISGWFFGTWPTVAGSVLVMTVIVGAWIWYLMRRIRNRVAAQTKRP